MIHLPTLRILRHPEVPVRAHLPDHLTRPLQSATHTATNLKSWKPVKTKKPRSNSRVKSSDIVHLWTGYVPGSYVLHSDSSIWELTKEFYPNWILNVVTQNILPHSNIFHLSFSLNLVLREFLNDWVSLEL